jgi:hypothetical protein
MIIRPRNKNYCASLVSPKKRSGLANCLISKFATNDDLGVFFHVDESDFAIFVFYGESLVLGDAHNRFRGSKKILIKHNEANICYTKIYLVDFLFELRRELSNEMIVNNLHIELINNLNRSKVYCVKSSWKSFFSLLSFYLDIKMNIKPEGLIDDNFSSNIDQIMKDLKSDSIGSNSEIIKNYYNVFEEFVRLHILDRYKFSIDVKQSILDNRSKLKQLAKNNYEGYPSSLIQKFEEQCDNFLKMIVDDEYEKINNEVVKLFTMEIIYMYKIFQKGLQILNTSYLMKLVEEQLHKQFIQVQEYEIESGNTNKLREIVSNNPGLNNDNIIKQKSVSLVNYLLQCPISDIIFSYLGDSKVEGSYKISGGIYWNNGEPIFVNSILEVKYNEIRKEFAFCDSNNTYVNINVPLVTKVEVLESYSDYEGNMHFQLSNINADIFSPIMLSEKHILVHDINGIPCLLNYSDFCNYSFRNNSFNVEILFYKRDIINNINNLISYLYDLVEDKIKNRYYLDIINEVVISDYKKDLLIVKGKNEKILNDFYNRKVQEYFIYQLVCRYKKDIILTDEILFFPMPNKSIKKIEGLYQKAQLLVQWYLKDFFEEDNWFYVYDTNKDDGSKVRSKEHYSHFNYKDFLLKDISKCKIIWNNVNNKLYCPYDFEILFLNVKYKIKVKLDFGLSGSQLSFSLDELEDIAKNHNYYLIMIISKINKGQIYHGIQLSEEYYGIFYTLKSETLETLKRKLPRLVDIYGKEPISFTFDYLELASYKFEIDYPILIAEPSAYNSVYWKGYKEYIYNKYFKYIENKLELFGSIAELKEINCEILELKMAKKFSI